MLEQDRIAQEQAAATAKSLEAEEAAKALVAAEEARTKAEDEATAAAEVRWSSEGGAFSKHLRSLTNAVLREQVE